MHGHGCVLAYNMNKMSDHFGPRPISKANRTKNKPKQSSLQAWPSFTDLVMHKEGLQNNQGPNVNNGFLLPKSAI